jgi:hypothetical protein
VKSFEQLVADWQAGTLTREELEQLRQCLTTAPGRKELLGQWLLDEAIYDTLRPEALAAEKAVAPSAQVVPWRRSGAAVTHRRWFPWLVWHETPISLFRVAAAAGLACLVMAAVVLYFRLAPVGHLAQVPGLVTLERAGRPVSAVAGASILPTDVLRLSSNAPQPLTLSLDAGATRLEVVPGAELRFENPWRGHRLFLKSGAVKAAVAPQSRWRPLTIATPQATAKVVGTRFTLSVAGNVTHLSVLEGAVRFRKTLQSPADSRVEVMVHGGQTVAAARDTKLEVAFLTGFLSSDRWVAPSSATLSEAVSKGAAAPEGMAAPPGSVVVERLRGCLFAPATGQFTFWLASLNGQTPAELWLSTDELPAHKQRLAWVIPAAGQGLPLPTAQTAGTGGFGRALDTDWRRSPAQKSRPVQLVAGRRYYVEVLHQGAGIEALALGWSLPGAAPDRPAMIDINALCPFVPESPGTP